MTATTFIFVRHAESEGVEEILVGRQKSVPLTETGAVQARQLATYLSRFEISRIISSPQQRTQQTAGIIAQRVALPFELSHAFNEFDFGDWTGRTFAELEEQDEWKKFNAFRSVSAAPGGESLGDVQHRAVRETLKLYSSAAGETVAIVTHADVIRATLAFFSGTPLDLFLRFRIDPASISVVEISHYGTEIRCVNQST